MSSASAKDNLLSALSILDGAERLFHKQQLQAAIKQASKLIRSSLTKHGPLSIDKIDEIMTHVEHLVSIGHTINNAARLTSKRLDLTPNTVRSIYYKHRDKLREEATVRSDDSVITAKVRRTTVRPRA